MRAVCPLLRPVRSSGNGDDEHWSTLTRLAGYLICCVASLALVDRIPEPAHEFGVFVK